MSKDTGGPAFPQAEWNTDAQRYLLGGGMTLRDYFAAMAMPEVYRRVESGGFQRVAQLAYEMADAMLAEGSKE